jgi:hypothetical protein
MENAARYAAEGRRYAGLDDRSLDALWTEAWEKELLFGSPGWARDCDNLRAELHLRGRRSPIEQIGDQRRRQIKACAARTRDRSKVQAELEGQLREFFDAWQQPRH